QTDVRISQEVLKQISESYRKIRNTFRFMLGNLNDFDHEKHTVSEANLEEVDQHMLVRLKQIIENVRNHYDAYAFEAVSQESHNFIAVDLSAFYLDLAKDILNIEHEDHPRRRSIQTVYYETLVSLVKLLAPIIPHTAEEVWEQIPGTDNEYVQLTDMPTFHEV